MPYLLELTSKIGNIVAGVSWNKFDADINVDANGGTYKADGNTYGIYAGINTGVVMLWPECRYR